MNNLAMNPDSFVLNWGGGAQGKESLTVYIKFFSPRTRDVRRGGLKLRAITGGPPVEDLITIIGVSCIITLSTQCMNTHCSVLVRSITK